MLNGSNIKMVDKFNYDSNKLDKKYLNRTEAHNTIQKGDIEGLKD